VSPPASEWFCTSSSSEQSSLTSPSGGTTWSDRWFGDRGCHGSHHLPRRSTGARSVAPLPTGGPLGTGAGARTSLRSSRPRVDRSHRDLLPRSPTAIITSPKSSPLHARRRLHPRQQPRSKRRHTSRCRKRHRGGSDPGVQKASGDASSEAVAVPAELLIGTKCTLLRRLLPQHPRMTPGDRPHNSIARGSRSDHSRLPPLPVK
jgi:hypothetical protein